MSEATITKKTKDSIHGITSNGFEFEIKKDVMDNAEFMEVLEEAAEDMPSYRKIGRMLLGDEQKKKMYDFFRTDDGRVPIDSVNTAFLEIIGATTDGKNS